VKLLSLLPCWRGRTGVARPAFGRGRFHVLLDGDRREYMFARDEFEVVA